MFQCEECATFESGNQAHISISPSILYPLNLLQNSLYKQEVKTPLISVFGGTHEFQLNY